MTAELKKNSELSTIGDILTIHRELKNKVSTQNEFLCQYCGKGFKRPKTLINHLCEGKRHWQQEKEMGVQHGLHAYIKFYQIAQPSRKTRSYADFVESPYYLAFVRFGRYCVDVRNINIPHYTEWLLRNNKKIDDWCKDSVYNEWLQHYLKTENPQDALERALKEMQDLASTENIQFNEYFKSGKTNRICQHITSGRMSAWVLYNCNSGVDFLSALTEDKIANVFNFIDPSYWSRKFKDYSDDTKWVKSILKEAGL